jgi:hypothetical protein
LVVCVWVACWVGAGSFVARDSKPIASARISFVARDSKPIASARISFVARDSKPIASARIPSTEREKMCWYAKTKPRSGLTVSVGHSYVVYLEGSSHGGADLGRSGLGN